MFPDGLFQLVGALGVIPWLEQPEDAVREMARVTAPGGHVLVTADNRTQLWSFIDPWRNLILLPLKVRLKEATERAGLRRPRDQGPSFTVFDRRFLDSALAEAGLTTIKQTTVGFGPLTLRGHPILPKTLGIALHRRLQGLVYRGTPGLRAVGMIHIVLAAKAANQPRAVHHK